MSQPRNLTEEHVAAAQLRLILDEKLGRTSPEVIRRIATMASSERSVPTGSRTTEASPEGATTPLRVLIADANPVFRSGLRALLESSAGIQIVGEASTSTELLSAASTLAPGVIVLDQGLSGGTGIEVAKSLLDVQPSMGVLVLTTQENEERMLDAMRAGVRGYLVDMADGDQIIRAVRAIGAGEVVFSPTVAERITGFLGAINETTKDKPTLPPLTQREREVLELLASGRSNAEIAELLLLSQHTVKRHVKSILTKLGVTDPAQAAARTREAGRGEH